MKLYGAVFALCVSSSVWGASAFAPQALKSVAFKSLSMSTPAGPGPLAGTDLVGTTPKTTGSGPSPVQKRSIKSDGKEMATKILQTSPPVSVQGGSLRTFSIAAPTVDAVQVFMKTEGRPLNANVDLWCGPDNTPQKMGVYAEDASMRPFNVVIATPRGQNTVAIRNTAQMEFPLAASVQPDNSIGLYDVISELAGATPPVTIQGGALKTYSFSPFVSSVQVLLSTDGRPLNARIELLQGPNNNKQVIEVYTEDGTERPFFAIFETPGVGNVLRVVNTAPVEFPMSARVEPYVVDPGSDVDNVVIDGGNVRMGGGSFGPTMMGGGGYGRGMNYNSDGLPL